ncbi:hypothetical protein MTO96_034007 [Rhipicephalus appendiculatus]
MALNTSIARNDRVIALVPVALPASGTTETCQLDRKDTPGLDYLDLVHPILCRAWFRHKLNLRGRTQAVSRSPD